MPLEDGSILFVNDYLVREGFAQVSTFPPDVKYADLFLKAQQEAKSQNKGLWAKCQSPQ
jgi:micrococcal nuclease